MQNKNGHSVFALVVMLLVKKEGTWIIFTSEMIDFNFKEVNIKLKHHLINVDRFYYKIRDLRLLFSKMSLNCSNNIGEAKKAIGKNS